MTNGIQCFFQGKKVKCSSSQARHKLFVGNLPRTWGEQELRNAVSDVGPGVTKIELIKVYLVLFASCISLCFLNNCVLLIQIFCYKLACKI